MATVIVCKVAECGNRVFSGGVCQKHYTRMRRHGSYDIPNPRDGSQLRELLALIGGDVSECIRWTWCIESDGRARIGGNLCCRILCESMYGPAPDMHASHLCGNGNGGCVNPAHLIWETPTANNHRKHEHGTATVGSKHPNARLSYADVQAIRDSTEPGSVVAARYGVSAAHVSNVRRYRRWLTAQPS